ncbi:hypothetical protein CPAST_c04680 [Clostridium pasteurianum DSM 525 = ATCC 6013]|uniref:Cyclic lactone autoinducer peptide n=1 Tax=Clostridium pasteurianum DSM 525 = ATCC 6013 TaxID=1262449 RepID=A0A0H3J3T1_CLOPA|nr:cyclic lactone autoinducer peptide [Clostridium pasteurianum]AJA46568.1 hypothetical protein CPAST_c04680 [Clostridium pasteurianum DSM 525 = ATCC 6013]AJA50556.1 hypothetical protein CLPA_c04680 [Clostridium pasteurianum DSM 525 = ATCC 6013]KRU13432.1 hypothetical protein CP6013_02680 [Clostridium pasteurianum DSM 525 = ATCC 6013]
MKSSKIAHKLSLLVCTIAIGIASTSSSMCILWSFSECKMPKSLYKID